jgi:hypothetical protein
MDAIALRPRLASFRVVSFSGKNDLEASGQSLQLGFEMTPKIDLDLRLPTEDGFPLQAFVMIHMTGRAFVPDKPDENIGEFEARYEARFIYPPEATEAEISPRFEREPYQYTLVSQTFPLAASHFRRELLTMGLDTRNLPLGL